MIKLDKCVRADQIVNFMLEAKSRLQSEVSKQRKEDVKKQKEQISDQIQKKQDQIDNIKRGLPSRKNRMKVSVPDQVRKRKQVLDIKKNIQDLRLKKSKI